MLEHPPKITDTNKAWRLLVDMRLSGELKPIQDEYLYWDKVKYKSRGRKREDFWTAVKLDRLTRQNRIQFGQHEFRYGLTDYMHQALHYFDLNIGGNLGSNIGIEDTDRHKYLISSLMEEAISSSQMEGANTTRKKAKEMIEKELKPKNRSERMILNNFITIRYIVQHQKEPLTEELLLNIHQLITSGTLDKTEEEGAFRVSDDVLVINQMDGEVAHTPPPAKELQVLIADLCEFFNEDQKDFVHPIIKGIIIHFMIGWIHPFSDGNGRTARALFYMYLLQKGYWLTEYLSISRIIKESKAQYERAYLYTETDELDMGYFITYHLKTMEKAFEALKKYINKKQREVIQAARFLRIPGVNERMAQLLKIMNDDAERILNSKEVENRFDISNFTARTDLKSLVEMGFMEIVQVNKIKQNFIRSKHFDKKLREYNI